MRHAALRLAPALLALVVTMQWSRPARADVTITGIVGEIGVLSNTRIIQFKMTDATQTSTCTSHLKYAWFDTGLFYFKETYAALLYSKKGAPITCTIDTNLSCFVTSCTLP